MFLPVKLSRPTVVRAMEEGLSRRRRLMAEERGEFLDRNPVAEDLPNEADDALSRRIREPDRTSSGVDNEQMATMEPSYEVSQTSDGLLVRDSGIERETGLGASTRGDKAEEQAEMEMIPVEEPATISLSDFRKMQEELRSLARANKELTILLQSGEERVKVGSNNQATMDRVTAKGDVGSRSRGSLEHPTTEGDDVSNRYLNESSLGLVDRAALDKHFQRAPMPTPAYQCEVRPGPYISRHGPVSEEATGGSSVSHNLLELEDAPVRLEQLRQGPVFVQGVGWVVPLGGKSSLSGSQPPPETGMSSEQPTPSPPWVGSPQPVGQAAMLGPVNPWAVGYDYGLGKASNPWVAQAESEWMTRARRNLEEELERRARKSVEPKEGEAVSASKARSHTEGFDTARSTHVVPPLPLPLAPAPVRTSDTGVGEVPFTVPPAMSHDLENWLKFEIGLPQASGEMGSRFFLQPSPCSVTAIAPPPPRSNGIVPVPKLPGPPKMSMCQSVSGAGVSQDGLLGPQAWVPPPPPGPPPMSPVQSPRGAEPHGNPQHTPGGTPVPPPLPYLCESLPNAADYVTGYGLREQVRGVGVSRPGDGVEVSTGAGEDERPERLEKYIPDLPVLSLQGDASTIVSDWIALSTPLVSSLSPSAGMWWREVISEAQKTYGRWLVTSPTMRLGMEPDKDGLKYRYGRYSLLEQRVLSMMLKAMPESIRQDVLNHRTMSCTAVLFKALCKVQPGSALDKSAMLSFIVNPPSAKTVSEALESLQKWIRVSRRTVEIHALLPDASLQLAGLDRIVQNIMPNLPAVLFRVNSHREAQRLDYNPTQSGVDQLAMLLISELEWSTLHSPGSENSPKPPKLPRVQRVDFNEDEWDKGGPKGKGRGGKGKGKDSPSSDSSPSRPKKPCQLFAKGEAGCTYGSKCRFSHDLERARKDNLCFHCGMPGHMADKCPSEANRKQSSGGTPVDPKVSAKAKAKTSLRKAQTSGDLESVSSATMPNPTAEALVAATKVLQDLSIKAVQVGPSATVEQRPDFPVSEVTVRAASGPAPRGLIDGGASHALRQAKPGEWDRSVPVEVRLAVGQSPDVRLNELDTLVSREPVQPIIPLGRLTKTLKCKVRWSSLGCEIVHPTLGRLPTMLINGCPEIPADLCLSLIEQLESEVQFQQQQQAQIARLAKSMVNLEMVPMHCLQEALRCGKLQEGVAGFCKVMWPELPCEVLQDLIPREWRSQGLPINRRKRRTLQRSTNLLLHLFSGVQRWSPSGSSPLWEIDLQKGEDLMSPDLYAFILSLAANGSVGGVAGGPPCRTTSRLRVPDGGPPPLRGRDGISRFGLQGLSKEDATKVHTDTVLWFRMFVIYAVSVAGRLLANTVGSSTDSLSLGRAMSLSEQPSEDIPPVFFVLEHPEDPCQYDQAAHPSTTPSLWAMPEVQRFAKEFRLKAVAFDQGALGHQQPKPTRLLTTSWVLYKLLQGRRVPQQHRKPVLRPQGWQERFQQSRSWAEWAPGLSQAVVQAWEEHQREPSRQLEAEQQDQAILKAISPSWEAHFHQDHRPFRRDCAVCLEASARQRPHYRQDHTSVFTMSMDIAGPLEKGVDSDAKTKHRYLLVATYAVPLLKDGEFVWTEHQDHPIPDCEEFLPDLEAPPAVAVDPLPEPAEDKRYSRVQDYISTISQPLKTKTLVICEPLPSRKQQDVRFAAMRLYVKLVNAGFPVHRVHSDRAKELVSLPLQTWFTEHGVALTTTIGEEPAANGRAEVGIQIIKSQVRRMMKAGSIPVRFWPAVARHASERIWRDSLEKLGVPQPALLACGTVVRAKPRSWVDRSNPWRDKMVEGKILSVAPSCAHGYAVLLPNESILLSSTVVAAPISLVSKPPAGWEKKHPTHRVRGKSHLRWILAPAAALHRARWSPRGESASSALEGASAEGARSIGASAEGARSIGANAEGARSIWS